MEYTADLTRNKKSTDNSILQKVIDFKEEMRLHELNQLNVYKKNPLISACDRDTVFYNRHSQQEEKLIMFGSNSYLGASNLHSAKVKASQVTLDFGIGSGGVPLLTGTTIFQAELEKVIAEHTGFDDSIVFSSGYTSNLGAITGLIRPGNLIIHDKLNHASLIDATIMAGADMLRYNHNVPSSLERLLEKNHQKYPKGILIVTDGVFSMDGDIANIPAILEIVRKYDVVLLIDDAHATGVIGKCGAGTLSHFGIKERNNIIVTGTLSKAVGAVGGYITASQDIIDYLRIYARSNMFSTSLPPAVCASTIEVFKAMQTSDIVERLNNNSAYLRKRMRKEGFNILNTETAIIPLIIGDPTLLTQMSKKSVEAGILINPIFPPAVPANLTRFRISVMATHTKEDMDYLLETIIKLFKDYGIEHYVK